MSAVTKGRHADDCKTIPRGDGFVRPVSTSCCIRYSDVMPKDPLKSPSDYEDPAEAVIAAAEWIVVDENTTVILEDLRRRREAREKD